MQFSVSAGELLRGHQVSRVFVVAMREGEGIYTRAEHKTLEPSTTNVSWDSRPPTQEPIRHSKRQVRCFNIDPHQSSRKVGEEGIGERWKKPLHHVT